MLSTALSYLSERRKKFHRSDTAPNLDEAERLQQIRLNGSSDIDYIFINGEKPETPSNKSDDKHTRKSRSRRTWRSKSPIQRASDENSTCYTFSQTSNFELAKSSPSFKYESSYNDSSIFSTLDSMKVSDTGSESLLSKSHISNSSTSPNFKAIEHKQKLKLSESDKDLSKKSIKMHEKEPSPQEKSSTPRCKSRAARMREKVVAKASRARNQNSSSSTIRSSRSRISYFSDQEDDNEDNREARLHTSKPSHKSSAYSKAKNTHRRAKSVDDKARRATKKKLVFEEPDDVSMANSLTQNEDFQIDLEQIGTLRKPIVYSLLDEKLQNICTVRQGITPSQFIDILNKRLESTAELHARLKVVPRPSTTKYGIFGKSLSRQSSSVVPYNQKLTDNTLDSEFEKYCKISLVNELFVSIERADFQGLLKTLSKYQGVNLDDIMNEVDLSPIDLAALIQLPNEYIASLYLAGFKLGPVMTTIFNYDPCKYSVLARAVHMDTMGSHLLDKFKEADAKLEDSKLALEYSLIEANQIGAGVTQDEYDESMARKVKTAFTKVSNCEKDIQIRTNYRDYLSELLDFHKRIPIECPAPISVRLMVKSDNTVLLKIKPPPQKRSDIEHSNSNPMSDTDVESDSSDESTSTTSLSTILGYRIEWSSHPGFTDDVHALLCEPLIDPLEILCEQYSSTGCYKTAFYEIKNIYPDNISVYFRVYALSLVGWSSPVLSKPKSVIPLDIIHCSGLIDPFLKHNNLLLANKDDTKITRFIGNKLQDKFIDFNSKVQTELLKYVKGYNSEACNKSGNNDTTSNTAESSPTSQNMQQSKEHAFAQTSSENTSEPVSQKQKSPKQQRRRSFRSLFGAGGNKFVRHTKVGVYLGVLCYTTTIDFKSQEQQHFVTLIEDSIPLIKVTNDEPPLTALKNEVAWLSKLACHCNQSLELKLLKKAVSQSQMPSSLQIKVSLLEALENIRFSLGSASVGKVYHDIIRGTAPSYESQTSNTTGDQDEDQSGLVESNSSSCPSIILVVKHVKDISDVVLTGGLRWNPIKKLLRKHVNKPDDILCAIKKLEESNDSVKQSQLNFELTSNSPESELVSRIVELLQFSQRENRTNPLSNGLFLVYLQMQAHLDQPGTILTWQDENVGLLVPFQKIRKRDYVSRCEWASLRKQSPDLETSLSAAKDLNILPDSMNKGVSVKFINSIYKAWVKLANALKLSSDFHMQCRIYLNEVVKLSETCSVIIVTPPIDQVCLPPGSAFETPANCNWTSLNFMEMHLASLNDPNYFKASANLSASVDILLPLFQQAKRQSIDDNEISQFKTCIEELKKIQTRLDLYWKFKRWISDSFTAIRDKSRIFATSIPIHLTDLDRIMREKNYMSDWTGMYDSGLSENEVRKMLSPPPLDGPSLNTNGIPNPNQMTSLPSAMNIISGTLRIYAGYKTGIAEGTSIRLLVSAQTKSLEIIRLVVKQLAKTVEKYRPRENIHPAIDNIDDTFCLTISVGEMERILPDSFHPLLLQAPWRAGRLMVRLKSETVNQKNFNSLIITRAAATKLYFAEVTPKPTIYFHSQSSP